MTVQPEVEAASVIAYAPPTGGQQAFTGGQQAFATPVKHEFGPKSPVNASLNIADYLSPNPFSEKKCKKQNAHSSAGAGWGETPDPSPLYQSMLRASFTPAGPDTSPPFVTSSPPPLEPPPSSAGLGLTPPSFAPPPLLPSSDETQGRSEDAGTAGGALKDRRSGHRMSPADYEKFNYYTSPQPQTQSQHETATPGVSYPHSDPHLQAQPEKNYVTGGAGGYNNATSPPQHMAQPQQQLQEPHLLQFSPDQPQNFVHGTPVQQQANWASATPGMRYSNDAAYNTENQLLPITPEYHVAVAGAGQHQSLATPALQMPSLVGTAENKSPLQLASLAGTSPLHSRDMNLASRIDLNATPLVDLVTTRDVQLPTSANDGCYNFGTTSVGGNYCGSANSVHNYNGMAMNGSPYPQQYNHANGGTLMSASVVEQEQRVHSEIGYGANTSNGCSNNAPPSSTAMHYFQQLQLGTANGGANVPDHVGNNMNSVVMLNPEQSNHGAGASYHDGADGLTLMGADNHNYREDYYAVDQGRSYKRGMPRRANASATYSNSGYSGYSNSPPHDAYMGSAGGEPHSYHPTPASKMDHSHQLSNHSSHGGGHAQGLGGQQPQNTGSAGVGGAHQDPYYSASSHPHMQHPNQNQHPTSYEYDHYGDENARTLHGGSTQQGASNPNAMGRGSSDYNSNSNYNSNYYFVYVPRDGESWEKVQAEVEAMHAGGNLSTTSAKTYIQALMRTMDKRNPVATTILFRKILEVLRYLQHVDKARPRRLPPVSAPVHLTLLVRCFESMIYGVGGAQFLTNPNYISQIYELYRSLQVKNSHATAAMLKAWGLVGNLRQCSIFIDQYRVLEKSQKNEIYAFLIYQSALDASLRHNNRELEQKIRHYIHVDGIEGVDEYWNRSVKVCPHTPPQLSHPHLFA